MSDFHTVPHTRIREGLEIILENYKDMNKERSKSKNRIILDALAGTCEGIQQFLMENNPDLEIDVNHCSPIGNWPDVAWIAFGGPNEYVSDKETFSLNINFQFTADKSGVILTLLPWVKGEWRSKYHNKWREKFEPYCEEFRNQLKWIEQSGFVLGNNIDIATKSQSSTDMRDSYIFYRFYPANKLPSEEEIQRDIAVAFKAQQQLTYQEVEPRTWAITVLNSSPKDANGIWKEWEECGLAEMRIPRVSAEQVEDLLSQTSIEDFEIMGNELGLSPEEIEIIAAFWSDVQEGDTLICVNGNNQAIAQGLVKTECYIDEDDGTSIFHKIDWQPFATPKPIPDDLRSKILKL